MIERTPASPSSLAPHMKTEHGSSISQPSSVQSSSSKIFNSNSAGRSRRDPLEVGCCSGIVYLKKRDAWDVLVERFQLAQRLCSEVFASGLEIALKLMNSYRRDVLQSC